MNLGSASVRLNPFKGCLGPQGDPVPWSPYGRTLPERPVFTLDPLLHAGAYYVQDASAMYVGHVFRSLLPAGGGLRVLDLCAAPGGKTTDLAASLREACGNDFLLVSNEVMRQRAAVLCDNVALWGDPNVVVTSVDPAAFARMPGFFDIIVADVPCSGEGMFRKNPRAREEWSPATVDLCVARQRRILADVWPALRQGGILIYSTCTFEERENDGNLQWAAAELGGALFPPVTGFEGVTQTACGVRLDIGERGEGQWVGALQRSTPAPKGRPLPLEDLHPLRMGVPKGFRKGADLVPNPDYALSMLFDKNEYPCVEADRALALSFLHRDALVLPDAPLGYVVITYCGLPLGFVKNLGRRCNNLHPLGRRIMMDVK